MAGIYDQMMGSSVPGFIDPETPDPHTQQISSGNAQDANRVLRVAWLIIILSLVGLWLLGATFK